ncbi:MAG: hypothetical protein ACMXYD_02950 [Candidatus Woesearchaeota archaeon]
MVNPFYFSDGKQATNTHELLAVLEETDEEAVASHVREGHFASWVEHELHNKALANRLLQCRSSQQVIDVLHLEHTPVASASKQESSAVIRDLQRPKTAGSQEDIPTMSSSKKESSLEQSLSSKKEQQESTQEEVRKPSVAPTKPSLPSRIPTTSSSSSSYNAKEFVLGLAIGTILGVLIHALIIALT